MTIVPERIQAELNLKCDGLGSLLSEFAERPLSDYLRHLSTGCATVSAMAGRSREYIATAARKLEDTGRYFERINVELALSALWRRPVMFTGPHSQLLPERFTLAGYMTGLAASFANQEQVCWMLPCATLRMQVANRKGPGWLSVNGRALNVFGLSIQELKWRRVCSPGRRLNFSHGELCAQSPRLDRLIGDISGDVATDLFQGANRRLLDASMSPSAPKIVDLDERFTAWVVAEHIESGETLVQSLFLSEDMAGLYRRSKEALRADDDPRSLRFPTEHLWAIDAGGHLVALEWSDGCLVSASDRKPVVRCEIADLVAGLRLGTLVPSLFLSYLVMGYLPSLNLAGGVRQPFYMNGFVKVWRELLSQYSTSQAKLHCEPKLNTWALNALDSREDIARCFLEGAEIKADEWIKTALELPLVRTSREFCSIVEHDFLRPPV
ncbi:hypothetical protein [Rhizobium leguminosarum]|uniref:hypothetical protein n=1 Tax=Rhizobium leguminosarum TaxID=384 RepID=UPI001C98D06E|nr:hypothetical protein [Rhizobium leguminosarum]MBY5361913.1 hypothetical protein [Rhizobium leguminosarum]MBY5664943.1 hypothetical protein [Rhizobium leguminosarum]MBY5677573.1 hypothetical protein [Rhizobium leguminosarum]